MLLVVVGEIIPSQDILTVRQDCGKRETAERSWCTIHQGHQGHVSALQSAVEAEMFETLYDTELYIIMSWSKTLQHERVHQKLSREFKEKESCGSHSYDMRYLYYSISSGDDAKDDE
jgi:hypothetical protein